MAVLKIKDESGTIHTIVSLKGERGEKGDSVDKASQITVDTPGLTDDYVGLEENVQKSLEKISSKMGQDYLNTNSSVDIAKAQVAELKTSVGAGLIGVDTTTSTFVSLDDNVQDSLEILANQFARVGSEANYQINQELERRGYDSSINSLTSSVTGLTDQVSALDEKVGDIDTALDAIIEIQNSLITAEESGDET